MQSQLHKFRVPKSTTQLIFEYRNTANAECQISSFIESGSIIPRFKEYQDTNRSNPTFNLEQQMGNGHRISCLHKLGQKVQYWKEFSKSGRNKTVKVPFEIGQQREFESQIETQGERLRLQQKRLISHRLKLSTEIECLRTRNRAMRQYKLVRNEQRQLASLENLSKLIVGMQYQNGIEIDTDIMSYEQLLSLGEQIGSVSKGISEEQIKQLTTIIYLKSVGDSCAICCQALKKGETVIGLECRHLFHSECIQEWLRREKVCPLCKQQISVPVER